MSKFFFVLFYVVVLSEAQAQSKLTPNTYNYDSTKAVFQATIEDVKWLTGNWAGKGFGGELEEIWSTPKAGVMVATFRMLENNSPVFYEMCMMAEEKQSVVYKVKHFNPDLTGWEEKNDYVTFPLVKLEKNAVYFRGLTMINRTDSIEIYLAMRQKDGSHVEEKLMYYRENTTPIAHHTEVDQASKLLHQEIDKQVWLPFMKAYQNIDNTAYIALHSDDLMRVVGGTNGSLQNKNEYSLSSLAHFEQVKNKHQKSEIAFSFLERNANESIASERGIYKYTLTNENGQSQHFYGKFHVFLRKINGLWKIVIDYDSNENGQIGEDDFKSGLLLRH